MPYDYSEVDDDVPSGADYVKVAFSKRVTETDEAILIVQNEVEYWIPFSQIKSIHQSPSPGFSHLFATKWIVQRKGLEF